MAYLRSSVLLCRVFFARRDGSASELEYHLLLARDLHLIDSSVHGELTQETTEIKRMLTGLIRKLKAES